MSLDSTLRGLAAEIGKNRNLTGSVAAPAKLRHRTGTIDAYLAGALTASVQIGADTIDAPFINTYSPVVGDAVSVLINNGSPLILGAVNKVPAAGGGGVIGSATYFDPGTSTSTSYTVNPSSLDNTDGDVSSIAYDASGPSPGVAMLDAGWYQVQAYAEVSGVGPTGTALMRLRWSTSGTDAWGVLANISNGGAMSATTVISRNFTPGGVVVVTITNPAGGTISTATVQVTRLAGP